MPKARTNTMGTTEAEAEAEAERLMSYWHSQGYTAVKFSISSYGTRKGKEYICGWTVKSNLDKYGNPIGKKEK